jgi:REP element-mobilizing transposase RayT
MGDSYQIKNQSAAYFLTFQVVGWADVFTRKMYKDIILESFSYCQKHKGMELFAYVIMSNHIHLIMRSKNDTLSELIRDLKKYTSKKILNAIDSNKKESRSEWLGLIFKYHAKYNRRTDRKQFWTHENHAVELDSNHLINSRINYIHENPVRAGLVDKPEDYLYSSARNYCDIKGLIDVERI